MEDFFMSHMYDNKEIVYMQWKYMNGSGYLRSKWKCDPSYGTWNIIIRVFNMQTI